MRMTRRAMTGLAALPLLSTTPAAARQTVVWPTHVTESPFGPSHRAKAAIREAADRAAFYPHAEEDRLIARIAGVNGVAPDQVAITSGALEVLSIVSLLWTSGGVQVAPDLTYDTHVRYALRNGAQARRVAMRPDQGIDLDAVSVAAADLKLTYLCNPNNPTGLLADRTALRDACIRAARSGPVLVDEAFIDMVEDPAVESVVDLVRDGHDVVVVGTFSKAYGLAGLRIGYVIGQAARIQAIRGVLTTSHNGPGLAAAAVSYRDRDYLGAANAATRTGREDLYRVLDENRIAHLPSVGSYVWIDLGPDAAGILARLAAAGTPLRQFGDAHPQWARVAVREPAAMAAFAANLPVALAGEG
jgi:histidinol-phosphate aminotransferase